MTRSESGAGDCERHRNRGINLAETAAIIAAVIFAALALFQAGLAAGAPYGHFAWGGQHRVLPTTFRIGSLASIVLYALMAIVLLDRSGATDLVFGGDTVRVLAWVVAGYLVIGVAMNAISRSKPERYTMTPTTIVLAILAVIVATG